jgi:transposase
VKGLRARFRDFIQQLIPENLIFIDEASSNRAMSREYGRGPRGERVHDAQPINYGQNLTMVGAISLSGFEAMMTIPGATTGPVFRAFVDHLLVPVLREGQTVVLDNLAAHKVEGVQEAIEACGAKVIYLPPYSPDFNPIELAWSKLKTYLRAVKARTLDDLDDAIADAMDTITPDNCYGWFKHCGYIPSI